MFEQTKAGCCRSGARPLRHGDHFALYLSRDSIQKLQALLLFGARIGGGGAIELRAVQLSLKTGEIFLFPHRQDALGAAGGVHSQMMHTLVCLSARPALFFKK